VLTDQRAARCQPGSQSSIADLQPRERRGRDADEPQHARRSIGLPDIAIVPANWGLTLLDDFEDITQRECHLPFAARRAVIEDRGLFWCNGGFVRRLAHS